MRNWVRAPSSLLLIIAIPVSFGLGFGVRNQDLIKDYGEKIIRTIKNLQTPTVVIKRAEPKTRSPSNASQPVPKVVNRQNWNGPEFWAAITAKRQEQALSPIPINELLCTLAAIRLAEIRRLGRLDDHDGFKPLVDKYQGDLNKEDLSNLFEFLTSGAPTAKGAVEGLYNTLGHKALFTEIYKAGCAYAADTFGVVITSK